jgi:hypothetical protein
MEAPDAGSEVRPCDSQKVEGLGIDDVKTAAPVHEHLGEARVTPQVFSSLIELHLHKHKQSSFISCISL